MDAKSPEPSELSRNLGIAGSILGILVAVFTLTGFNPLATFFKADPPTDGPDTIPSTTKPADVDIPGEGEKPISEDDPNDDAPSFSVTSNDWNGACDSGCPMVAVFHNSGGMAGSATATFYVTEPSSGDYLARCSVVIPKTAHDEKTSTGCTASSANLTQYFQSYREVQMYVAVDNP